MRTNYKPYDFEKSRARIDKILSFPTEFEESDNIPSSENLTYSNGKYVKCAAMFIDLRGSTKLIKKTGRKSRTLARIYRAYISEMVAILNGHRTCQEINIVGDCVSAIFAGKPLFNRDTPVIEALKASAKCNSMMTVLNKKFKQKYSDFEPLQAGIGIAYGRALVVKAGFDGSGINDLIYMGDVVNMASKMCNLAYKTFDFPICVTEGVYNNAGGIVLNPDTGHTFQHMFEQKSNTEYGTVYLGRYFNIEMNEWNPPLRKNASLWESLRE